MINSIKQKKRELLLKGSENIYKQHKQTRNLNI